MSKEQPQNKLAQAIKDLAKLPQFYTFLEHVYIRLGARRPSRHMDGMNRYDAEGSTYNLGMSEAWFVIEEQLPPDVLLELLKGVKP